MPVPVWRSIMCRCEYSKCIVYIVKCGPFHIHKTGGVEAECRRDIYEG